MKNIILYVEHANNLATTSRARRQTTINVGHAGVRWRITCQWCYAKTANNLVGTPRAWRHTTINVGHAGVRWRITWQKCYAKAAKSSAGTPKALPLKIIIVIRAGENAGTAMISRERKMSAGSANPLSEQRASGTVGKLSTDALPENMNQTLYFETIQLMKNAAYL